MINSNNRSFSLSVLFQYRLSDKICTFSHSCIYCLLLQQKYNFEANFLVRLFFYRNFKRTVVIKKLKTQLPELQQKEVLAISKLNKVWDIPDEYCYEYALTKMLQYIDSFKAHNWKEVTTLYDRHVHEQTMEYNTRISAEDAIKQTEIARETRNAARAAAVGAGIAAVNSWR